jgi:hypothetical protein
MWEWFIQPIHGDFSGMVYERVLPTLIAINYEYMVVSLGIKRLVMWIQLSWDIDKDNWLVVWNMFHFSIYWE